MRLPILQTDQGIPQPPAPTASMALYGGPAAAAGALAQEAGHSAAVVSSQFIQIEAEQARIDGQTRAMDLFIDASHQADALNEQLKLDPQADPQTHFDRFTTGYREIVGQTMGQAGGDARVTRPLYQMLQRLQIEKQRQALSTGFAMFLDQQRAADVQAADTMAQEAAKAPTTEGKQFFVEQYERSLRTKYPAFSQQEIEGKLVRFRQDVATFEAHQEIAKGTFEVDRYADRVSPDRLIQLTDLSVRAARQRQADAEKALGEYRATATDDLESRVLNAPPAERGQFLSELEEGRRARTIIGDDYRRLHKAITEPGRGVDDPTTRRDLEDRLYRVPPRVSLAEISRAEAAGLLTPESGRVYRSHLQTTLQQAEADRRRDISEARTAASEARTEARFRHAQAEQLVTLATTTRSPLEPLDPVATDARIAGFRELTRRSRAMGGQEDPLAIADEVIPGLQITIAKNAMSAAEQLERQAQGFQAKSPEALEQAWKAKRIPEAQYQAERKVWIEITKLRAEEARMRAEAEARRRSRGGK